MSIVNSSKKNPEIGEIYLMHFDGVGSEQNGWRPGLVFQNNVGNEHSPNVIVLPLTSSMKKLGQPTHVFLPKDETGLARDSIVLCENPQRMSKDRLGSFILRLTDEYMAKIAEANILATSAISFLDPSCLMTLWEKANKLNSMQKSA